MNFQEYSDSVLSLARYPNVGSNLIYPVLGLAGEAGEAAEKVKKLWRDHGEVSDPMRGKIAVAEEIIALREGLIKELGDCLWYVAATAKELGIDLEEIARKNIEKLHGRRERGTLAGSGDSR